MKRKEVSRIIIFLLLSVFLHPLLISGQSGKPNIIFIPVDELNNWMNYINDYPGAVHTPNIDRLVAEGVSFTHAYCNAPACSPSRASFLSGLQPSTSGAYYGEKFRKIMPDVVTLPQFFREHGYTTMGCGKIFHSFTSEDPKSWDEYLDGKSEPRHENYPYELVSNYADHQWAPTEKIPEETLGDYKDVSWAIEKLEMKHERPFFLGVGFIKPHHPWVVPKKYFDMYPLKTIRRPQTLPGDLNDLPSYGHFYANMRPQLSHEAIVAHDQWDQAIQGFLASVTYMDAQLGRLLDALENSPYANNTIIVLFGDNGMHFGEKEHWTKWALWEQATQVPLIITGPGVAKPGSLACSPVGLVDVYPTLVELAGFNISPSLDGESLLPMLKNPDAKRSATCTYDFWRA